MFIDCSCPSYTIILDTTSFFQNAKITQVTLTIKNDILVLNTALGQRPTFNLKFCKVVVKSIVHPDNNSLWVNEFALILIVQGRVVCAA